MALIVLKATNGKDILVEVDDEAFAVPRRGGVPKRGGETIADKARAYTSSFASIGQYIMTVCDEIYDKYNAAAEKVRPDQMEIQFGIKLSGEGGVPFLSKGAAEATIQVTAKWAKTQVGTNTPAEPQG